MRRIGELVDAVAAFLGAAVAGVALFLPITFTWTANETSQFRVASLINSVPRGAACGAIVAVAVAVLLNAFSGPAIGWLTALGGALGLFLNHLVGRNVSSAEILTTQNYVDALCAGVLLGALGSVVLGTAAVRRPLPAFGFVLGGAGFFVFGDLAELLDISDQDPYTVLETPPRWLISLAVMMLVFGFLRNRTEPQEPQAPRMAVELPVAPILASGVLSLVILAITEWLVRQYENAPYVGHGIEVGVAVIATVLATTVAAMLLPGRDGVGVYLAVCLVAVGDAIGVAPRPGWSVLALIGLVAMGMLAGIRVRSVTLAIALVGGLAIYAMLTSAHNHGFVVAAGSAALALIAGFCCGVARPQYAPSGVLAIAALYLPSIVTALRRDYVDWDLRNFDENGLRDRTALAIVIGCAIGLIALSWFRPRKRRKPDAPAADAALADI